LRALEQQGIPCAVATSTRTETAIGHLRKASLHSYFRATIGGDRVTRGKPDSEIYLKAASELGVSIEDCAIFEDSDPGTLAAIASGARVVQVPDVKPPSAALKENGHLIAETLLGGARKIGLVA